MSIKTTYSLHVLQLNQRHVGAQSLGKRTRSIETNVVAPDTGVGGREGVSRGRALVLDFNIDELIRLDD